MKRALPPIDLSPLHAARESLLGWFAIAARDLPWRRTRDPYEVLVAEMMLQQTQVERVVPKYHAFLEQYPNIHALAEAPTGDIIRAWAGLGYNRRALYLQRTARAVIELYGGIFPRELPALRALPGIGPYTAGAIACFAFEQDVAFADTNIQRVLYRLLGVHTTDIAPSRLPEATTTSVPPGQGWHWNQALMELGARICTANAPDCAHCPVRDHCRDHATRTSATLPGSPTRAARRIAERRQPPFEGSRRYYRGRLIDALRELPAGTTTELYALGSKVKPAYHPDDAAWLYEIAASLARDGLLVLFEDNVRLPE